MEEILNNKAIRSQKPIAVNYSDETIRILVEEYLTQQQCAFSLKGVCNYVLYWAMEDGKATHADNALYDGNTICHDDCDHISQVLARIAREGRIAAYGEQFEILNN